MTTKKTLKKPTKSKPKKLPSGRPTKWDPSYCDLIVKYFSRVPRKKVKMPHYDKDGNLKWTDYKYVANALPTFLGFSKKIGVNGDTIVEWSKPENKKKYPGFSAAYAHAKDLQKDFLIENGLNGSFNSQFAIFVAKNITDMKDKQEVDAHHTGNIVVERVNYQLTSDDSK